MMFNRTCKQAHKLMAEACDHKLPWRERLALRLHLMICDACSNFGKQLALLAQAMRRLGEH